VRSVVVGGGLAGLSAALELTRTGQTVTLLEARPTLGGAVQTLPERSGDPSPPPDNGQHVALACCSAYVRFLEEIGQAASLRRLRLALPVVDERARVGLLGASPLTLLRYRHVSLADRVRIATVVRRLGKLHADAHDGETFADLLRRLGQSEAAIARFWDVFMRPALNLRSEEASAALGVFTVQRALLGGRGAGDLLVPTAPLGEMHGEAAGAELRRRGGEIRTNARAVALEADAVVLGDGARVDGDAFVLALPPHETAGLLGETDPGLDDSPIVSVHLVFDRPILRFPLAALLASEAHWVFDRGRLTGSEPARGQYLTVVASGAPELLELRGRALVDRMAGELTARLGRADLLWSRVSREPAATFAGRPGTAALRLPSETARPNVVRAGAWTATGWPATMESAVRSGIAAVQALRGHPVPPPAFERNGAERASVEQNVPESRR
jgi:squalene-associated FAD-dependent desaturase